MWWIFVWHMPQVQDWSQLHNLQSSKLTTVLQLSPIAHINAAKVRARSLSSSSEDLLVAAASDSRRYDRTRHLHRGAGITWHGATWGMAEQHNKMKKQCGPMSRDLGKTVDMDDIDSSPCVFGHLWHKVTLKDSRSQLTTCCSTRSNVNPMKLI